METNAIGFSDEYSPDKRTWVVGYYLNNARFRGVIALQEIEKHLKACGKEEKEIEPYKILREKLEVGISEDRQKPRDLWDETYMVLKALFTYIGSLRPATD